MTSLAALTDLIDKERKPLRLSAQLRYHMIGSFRTPLLIVFFFAVAFGLSLLLGGQYIPVFWLLVALILGLGCGAAYNNWPIKLDRLAEDQLLEINYEHAMQKLARARDTGVLESHLGQKANAVGTAARDKARIDAAFSSLFWGSHELAIDQMRRSIDSGATRAVRRVITLSLLPASRMRMTAKAAHRAVSDELYWLAALAERTEDLAAWSMPEHEAAAEEGVAHIRAYESARDELERFLKDVGDTLREDARGVAKVRG